MAPHPGQILVDDLLIRGGLSTHALAAALEVTPALLMAVIAEELPMSRDLAERLGVAYGPSASYWLALQAAWDREQYLTRFAAGPRRAA